MNDVLANATLTGKVALISGASALGGINLGIAQRLAAAGASVVIFSRSQERIDAAAKSLAGNGGSVLGLSADVRDYAALEGVCRRTVETFGRIDIVVAGAAGNFHAPAAKMSANAFKTVVDIDLLGTFNLFRASFEHLSKPGASLMAITAKSAIRPSTLQAHANAAKAGVNMLVKCLALEWGPAGIRVNGLAPGPIEGTVGIAKLVANPAVAAAYQKSLALRRFGTAREVGDMALFLCSDNARYVTGTILECDGGDALGDASADALGDAWARHDA